MRDETVAAFRAQRWSRPKQRAWAQRKLASDGELRAYVLQLAQAGASDQSIAAALSHSQWASPSRQGQWHWRRVQVLRAAVGISPPDRTQTDAGADATRLLQISSERRAAVDRARARAYPSQTVERVRRLLDAGLSASSIASVLNQDEVPSLAGRRWCARTVDRMILLTGLAHHHHAAI